ncbi:hypothetical protein Har1130_02385 [Haloarcula sp. CBA1130]|uniref:hypothetical protein n=1 Tax=unclassified Haloarcula TaxID=2624677 RepID=UPI0012454A85|nr:MULTISPECIES: hypothetical protein [unclassified Haloarcula]KAA9399949.1 hypothetical protein Har1129_17660 [Haloarcula sp. CBA1129]KAA9401644.1 hypothetical protein Har1130_02385 [Haloarcula sp. CBA1130]
MPDDADTKTSTVSRRRVITTAGASTVVALAGCNTGGDGAGDGESGGGQNLDPVRERAEVAVSDIQEGGTLRFGLGAGIDSFDPSYSTSAPAGEYTLSARLSVADAAERGLYSETTIRISDR